MQVVNNLLDLIGNTPLVEISQLTKKEGVRIFAKIEGTNPTGSIKDRIAQYMLDKAESNGDIKPGQTILEPTSGNTGIALALQGKIRGYPVKVVMPASVSEERFQLLKTYGAEIIVSPGHLGSNGAVALSKEISKEHPEWFYPCQYENAANPLAHYETTGPEIIAQMPDITHFVSGLGTGGTLTGVGKFLKEQNKDIKIIAAAPHPDDLVQGLRSLEDGYVPPVFDPSVLDGQIVVDSKTSFATTKKLMSLFGIFSGISCGAVVRAAEMLAERIDEGNIVLVLADGGWKYLSTNLWTKDYSEIEEDVKDTLWW
ncbi:MAG: cysteine synthase family protein [Dehalococcoidia bacterium]|jgi:cysteine synthase|nr:MAG: cysteine synthase B [Chloroflexota bacterium]|tara:strand:+ start:434 stop:1372 length:939 start_codon:yes stop_codon:yes gene_type:complete